MTMSKGQRNTHTKKKEKLQSNFELGAWWNQSTTLVGCELANDLSVL